MNGNDALILIFSRNAFYKRLHFLALGAFGLCVIIIVILILMLAYLLRNPPHPLYFATDNVGRLVQVVPVNTPNMSQEDVTAWAVEAVEAAFSYDFINYRAQLQDAEKYFTSYGWTKYMNALTLSGNLRALTVRKQIVLADVIGTPKITRQGLLGGSYAWMFDMPLLVTYMMPPYDGQPGDAQYSNALTVSIIVQRQKVLEGYKGLGIVQLVASAPTATNTALATMTNSTG